MSVKTTLDLFLNGQQLPLNRNKVLVGSAENCDLVLNDPSIASYHAMVLVDLETNTYSVIDLESQNGTYINGVRVGTKSAFFDGDKLTFGKLHCDVVETIPTVAFENADENVTVFDDLQSTKVYIPEPQNDGEVLIDDEYCDIVFNDEEFIPLHQTPVAGLTVNEKEYIETEALEDSFDILEENDQHCVRVTTSLNGSILEQYYFPLKAGTIYASNRPKKNHVVVDILESKKPQALFKLENNAIRLAKIDDFQVNKGSMNIDDGSTLILSRGTYQVFIEVAEAPDHLVHISSLRREKAFYQDAAKKFAAVILPMLLLLLVDFSIEKQKPLKQLSIIYKKPTNANVNGKKMASAKTNNTKKDTGHKTKKQPDKKISRSKSGNKAQPKKAPAKKVAKTKSKRTRRSKAKTKSYNFKLATNVNSMFSNSKSVAISNTNTPSTVKTTSSVSGSLNTKVRGTSTSKVGRMGSDSSGRALASFGSKGLSSKSGRDTAYIQTETVVLGSMDPELLRKILQQYLPQFRHCYQKELAYNRDDIKGVVDLNFEITPSGRVSKAKVRAKDSRFSKRGLDCMKRVLAVIDFPKPKGGGRVAVRQPLSFFSEQEKG